ncbi:MAG: hypothetical protein WA982_10525 [Rubrobacteraceae bacterium]
MAEKVTGYAEEVVKLVAALKNDNCPTAAVQRNLLAVHLATVLAVHHRLLYDSENHLWELVASLMGKEWSRNQHAALGLHGETLEASCTAALSLYKTAVADVYDLFNDRQKAVVEHAKERCRQLQSASL